MSFTCSLFIYLCVHMLSLTLSRSVTLLPYLSLSHTHTNTHTQSFFISYSISRHQCSRHYLHLMHLHSPPAQLPVSSHVPLLLLLLLLLLLISNLCQLITYSLWYTSPPICYTYLLSLLSHLHLKPPNLLYRKLPLQDRDHKNILNHRTLHCPLRQQLLPNKIKIKIEISIKILNKKIK